MIDLSNASLNVQIIAIGVFLGMVAAWIVRSALTWLMMGLLTGCYAIYALLEEKCRERHRTP